MDQEIADRLELARQIAREAGRLTLKYFAGEFVVDWKSDKSPVTIADRQAELLLRERIAERFSEDGILGEEFGETSGTSGFRWVLDPIDGTKSFVSAVPLYGTLIGIELGGECVIGVVELPALDRRIYASKRNGAFWQSGNGPLQKAAVSECRRLSDGLYVTSEIKTFRSRAASAAHERLEAMSWIARTWGDCYGYFLVATGKAVAMVDPIMNVWDAAAIQPIIDEAGGSFTDWVGRAVHTSGEAIATNGRVHAEVLAITREFGSRTGSTWAIQT